MHKDPSKQKKSLNCQCSGKPQEGRGVIRRDELYTLEAFKLILGIADATLRAAKRADLEVYYVHKRGFIYGDDWIDYVLNSAHPADQSGGNKNQ